MPIVRERRAGKLTLQLHEIGKDTSPLAIVQSKGGSGHMIRFLRSIDAFDRSDCIVVALAEGKAVGAFGVQSSEHSYPRGLWGTCGTYVLPAWRRRGVSTAMWNFMVSTKKIERIYCVTISNSGFQFAQRWKNRRKRSVKVDVSDYRGW